MVPRIFISNGAAFRRSLILSALTLSFLLASRVEAQNLIFTFSDDGKGGTRVIASGGTATAVGTGGNPLIGVRATIDGGNIGFGFVDDAFPFDTFDTFGGSAVPMSDSMTLVPGGGLKSGEIAKSIFNGRVFTPFWLGADAQAGATLSAVGAPDPVGTLSIPYEAFASLDGTIIVNSEDGWEFHFRAIAKVAPGDLQISSIRKFGRTVVGKKSRPKIIRITNTGQSDVDTISLRISGRASREFDATPASSSLAAGNSTNTKVTFEPKRKGRRRATMTVSSSAGNQVVTLIGRAVAPMSGYQVPRGPRD
jgi:hypothetical protein